MNRIAQVLDAIANNVATDEEVDLRVVPPSDISRASDLAIGIGQAEDGLPLVLDISRRHSTRRSLDEFSERLQQEAFAMTLDEFQSAARKEAVGLWQRVRRIWPIDIGTGTPRECYVTYRNLSDLFHSTLLSKVVKTPYVTPTFGRGATQGRTRPVSQGKINDVRVESTGGTNRFLAISLGNGDLFSVGWEPGKGDLDAPKMWRSFIAESVWEMRGTRAQITRSSDSSDNDPKRKTELIDNASSFAEALTRQALRGDIEDISVAFQVSRQTLAVAILDASKALAKMHSSGAIHGDLKPENILYSKDGPWLIDAFPLEKNEVSPGLSPGWAAPEQVMLRPVCEATDIYPLGMMLNGLLGGILTGKVTQYMLPPATDAETSGAAVSFIEDPTIYVNRGEVRLERKSIEPWLAFIERCLRFNPMQRFKDAREFAERLESLVREHPLQGYEFFPIQNTSRLELGKFPDGRLRLCHVLDDSNTSLNDAGLAMVPHIPPSGPHPTQVVRIPF